MKPMFWATTLVTMAVAVTATTCAVSSAQGQTTPAPATADSGVPADILPGSPLADVVKMLQAGVDAATIKGYILNCQSQFGLDADKISYLRDLGASSDVINAMLDRDKVLFAASAAPAPAPVPAPMAVPAPEAAPAPQAAPEPAPMAAAPAEPMAAPAVEVNADYFNSTLTPYGSWVDVEGYGRCWRPTVAVYNAGWSPYGDGGHWVYSDCGWYWDSEYAWGTTFHYGRWFRNPQFGWCWYPDTVWAPSWVMWRSSDDYCGWAPLPPFAVFTPGVGFYYRGVAVGVDFDFGLGADCFLFVGPDHFSDRHPHSFFVSHDRAIEVFHHTTIMNHYEVRGHSIVNRGFGTERIAAATHHPVEPVHMGSLPNAGRQGYRGEGFQQTMHPTASTPREAHPNEVQGRTALSPNNQVRSAGEAANTRPAATTVHPGATATQPQPGRNTTTEPSRTTPPTQYENRTATAPGGAATGGAVQERSGVKTQTHQSTPEVSHPADTQAPAHAATQPGQPQPQPQAKGNQGNNPNNPNNKKQNQ